MPKSIRARKKQMQFYLISANFNRLKMHEWNHPDLAARFWRLYHHDVPGGNVVISGETHPLLPEYVYLIPPNVHFASESETDFTQFCLHFQIPPFIGLTGENLHMQKVTPAIVELLELCWKHYRNTDIENLRLCGLALASYCIAKLPEGMLRKIETVDYRIARLCSNIEGLYREETSIRRMIKITGMGSKSTLMRNFRKATGTTPHQFLIKSKYAYGAELLTTTQYTVGEISEMIGVNNQFLFSRTFKKIYGVSPSLYRKKMEDKK